uniref:Ribonuclease Z n=1 Tax=Pleonosporium borreri TaxID=2575635 RepID=A0A4D6X1W8_9FLOR|nr:ribonuclease Z [Pleonosporium borreri]
MQIINVKKYSIYISNSFILKLHNSKDLILFNCSESLQSYIITSYLKMNNLSTIIITNLDINNISGLLGLLSSLHSIGRIKELHIYGPKGLAAYLDLGKKYSHTNFRYMLYIHILSNGLIIDHFRYRMYTFFDNYYFNLICITPEIAGTFQMGKAIKNYIFPSYLYSQLKKGNIFILPDGLILDGIQFINISSQGSKFMLQFNNDYYKNFSQNCDKSMVL